MKQVVRKVIKEKYNIEDKEPIHTLVVDGNALLKQSMVHEMKTEDGKDDYGAVWQFYKTLGDVINRYNFNFCYIFFDADNSGVLRARILNEYKANRDKNYALSEYDKKMNDFVKAVIAKSKAKKGVIDENKIKEKEKEDIKFSYSKAHIINIAEYLYIRNYECEDIEGDDLIAYYVKHKQANEKVVIMTRDRDLTQLISDDVIVYLSDKKEFVTKKNDIKQLGYPASNVVLCKIMCGDSSDNIYGIEGMGEKTFFNLFPDVLKEKKSVDDILSLAKEINAQRTEEKKKPLKVITNLLEQKSKGSQNGNVFEINKKIIDLSEPMMSSEACEDMNELMSSPLGKEGRGVGELYKYVCENKMVNFYVEDKFSNIFGAFNKIIEKERKFNGFE